VQLDDPAGKPLVLDRANATLAGGTLARPPRGPVELLGEDTEAAFKISFALRSSRTSRSSNLNRSRLLVVSRSLHTFVEAPWRRRRWHRARRRSRNDLPVSVAPRRLGSDLTSQERGQTTSIYAYCHHCPGTRPHRPDAKDMSRALADARGRLEARGRLAD
jgi:hypothetical protein